MRNAVRHAPRNTAVEIGLDLIGDVATISVRDHGPGVPDDSLDAIFEPFVRVEGDRSRASGGVGLGLAIARRAVGLHRGTITAQNAHPGLLVQIELPGAVELLPETTLADSPSSRDTLWSGRVWFDGQPWRFLSLVVLRGELRKRESLWAWKIQAIPL